MIFALLALVIGLIGGITVTCLYFILLRRAETAERVARSAMDMARDLQEQLDGRSVPYKFRRKLEDFTCEADYIHSELKRVALYVNQERESLNDIERTAQRLVNHLAEERRMK